MIKVFFKQKTERSIKKLELTPDARLLEHYFSTIIQNRNNDTKIKIINKFINYLKRLIFSELYG